jgi:5-methylcytosine-specific restriction endonuclease McrA
MNAAQVLMRPTLVLNKRWVPITTTTVQEAIGLVSKGRAMILEPGTYAAHDLDSWDMVSKAKNKFGEGMLRSQYLTILPPEVIVLNEYAELGQKSVVFSRKNLFKRDKYTCQYCGKQPGPDELTVDHVVPRSKGGISSWTNCVLACVPCNKKKADKSLEKSGLKIRRMPRKPSWKALAQISPHNRLQSWDDFLAKAYWEVELEE